MKIGNVGAMALSQVVEPQRNEAQCQQLGARIAVIQVSPHGVENCPHDQRACENCSHLDFIDAEGFHDRRGERADQQLVGLVQQHEEEKCDHNEPAVA